MGVSQNGGSFLPPPRPPDHFLKLFFLFPYFWLSWKYVQEVLLLWVYCVPHSVHLYKIGKFQFRKFYEFFWSPFSTMKKKPKHLSRGIRVWLYGIKGLAYNDFCQKIARNKPFCCLNKAVRIGKFFLMKFLLILWFFFSTIEVKVKFWLREMGLNSSTKDLAYIDFVKKNNHMKLFFCL